MLTVSEDYLESMVIMAGSMGAGRFGARAVAETLDFYYKHEAERDTGDGVGV